jgi:copper oxidase (laccase) domain-containing protein
MNIVFAVSNVSDGTMSIKKDQTNKPEVLNNRKLFLAKFGITPEDSTRIIVTYDGDNYRRYRETGHDNLGEGMFNGDAQPADALVTKVLGQALFLPLADCVGAAIFDQNQNILMLSHIGRQSLEQFGARASIEYLVNIYKSDPADLSIWLTAAPGQQSYPLFAFNNRSFKEVVFEQLKDAGILEQNIHDDPADTTADGRYYSHSEFLAGRQKDDGRYAVVAMMKP